MGALFDGLAALEEDGLHAVADEAQGAEEPCGACARDEHFGRGARDAGIGARGRLFGAGGALHRIHPLDISLVARVERFFEDAEVTDGRVQPAFAQLEKFRLLLPGAQGEVVINYRHKSASEAR